MPVFNVKFTSELVKAVAEGGSITLLGPDADPDVNEQNARADAEYLKLLYQALRSSDRAG